MTAPVRVARTNGVVVLTLDRPSRRNALSLELLRILKASLDSAIAEQCSAVVLTGADGCFSAGADLSELTGTAEDLRFDDALADIVEALRRPEWLSIAAVEGVCIGAGLDLALACDARVISPDVCFELPAVRLGLLYNPAAIMRMRRRLAPGMIVRLLLLGERIGHGDALVGGLATHSAASGRTQHEALAIANRLRACPRALAATKGFLRALDRGAPDLDEWQTVRLDQLGSPERAAALAAAKLSRQSKTTERNRL